MTDAITATESAVYPVLAGNVGGPVFQHVPENTPPPLVIIGDVDNLAPIAEPGDPDRRMTLTIVVLTEGQERQPCSAIIAKVEALLDGEALTTVQGWTIALTLQASSATLAEDGLGYIGLVQFGVIALTD